MLPHDGVGGTTLSPRKESVASTDDGRRDQQRRVDNDRRGHVRQDLDEHDARVTRAQRARRLDVLELADRQRLRRGRPSHGCPGEEGDDRDADPRLGPTTATSASAKTRNGSDRTTSISRERDGRPRPPYQPAAMPTTVPTQHGERAREHTRRAATRACRRRSGRARRGPGCRCRAGTCGSVRSGCLEADSPTSGTARRAVAHEARDQRARASATAMTGTITTSSDRDAVAALARAGRAATGSALERPGPSGRRRPSDSSMGACSRALTERSAVVASNS